MDGTGTATACKVGQFQVGGSCYETAGALRRHGEFFANNHALSYASIYEGFRKIGMWSIPNHCFSFLISSGSANNTRNLAENVHVVSTGVYDDKGNFVVEKFKELYKFDANKDCALDENEMATLRAANYETANANAVGFWNRVDVWFKSFIGRGEFGMLADFVADCQVEVPPTTWGMITNVLTGNHPSTPVSINAISFDKLARFYLGGREVFDEKAASVAAEAAAQKLSKQKDEV